MTEPTEKDLLQAAGRLLRQSEHELDELTSARLRAARLGALEAKARERLSWPLSGGAVAAGLALALAGVLWLRAPSELPVPPGTDTTVADLDLLAIESPEFYTELEFYRWLASQPDAS